MPYDYQIEKPTPFSVKDIDILNVDSDSIGFDVAGMMFIIELPDIRYRAAVHLINKTGILIYHKDLTESQFCEFIIDNMDKWKNLSE